MRSFQFYQWNTMLDFIAANEKIEQFVLTIGNGKIRLEIDLIKSVRITKD